MDFKELESYKELKRLDGVLFAQVEKIYSMVKETLNSITSSFGNYTMHDIGHSVRVAQYMEQLAFGIDDERAERIKKFNAAEFAILLLSALLHDVGMFISPEDAMKIKEGKIQYSDSLTYEGVLSVKNGDEKEAIKEIVRLTHAARVNDFLDYKINGEETISKILQIDNKYSYAEDIALICQAHGENYDFIKNKLRTSTTKGKYEYNQQYFAVLLRIADLLDLDKQRTPILWFSKMGIEGFSKTEWETHFQISNEKKLKKYFDGKMQVYFDGESSNAKIHRKYLKYIDNLKIEIENADSLLNNKDALDKYKLNLSTKIEDLVKTKGFQYSDLRLNLDYAAITELLMGKNIYGDNKLGLRELLQNSIDACKIMEEVGVTMDAPKPSIHIKISESKNYVKIKDTGIGMTLDVVKNHFLNIGKSYYKSNAYLFNNYKYKPIGQYGIGFLACFLLSDNVIVKTRYYKSNEIIQIELEKNSEYVVTNSEESQLFYGTEIQLEYNKFFEVFKNFEQLRRFLSHYFFTEIPIFILDEDKNIMEEIKNINYEKFNIFLEQNKIKKYEKINCSDFSNQVTGEIILLPKKSQFANNIEKLSDKENYLFDSENHKFVKVQQLDEGNYHLISYAKINKEDYERITKTKKEIRSKVKEIKAFVKKNNCEIRLFYKSVDNYHIPRYFYDLDNRRMGDSEKMMIESGLDFYHELFYNSPLPVFVSNNEFIHLYYCGLINERYIYEEKFKNEYTNIYYKDIRVRDFRNFGGYIPYNFEARGFFNYHGKEIKLDVSRNEIIEGSKYLNKEFKTIVLNYKLTQEKDPKMLNFLNKLISYQKG